jgi:hypothetical protein
MMTPAKKERKAAPAQNKATANGKTTRKGDAPDASLPMRGVNHQIGDAARTTNRNGTQGAPFRHKKKRGNFLPERKRQENGNTRKSLPRGQQAARGRRYTPTR